MLDIGWSEMAIVAVVALFVIGPRELPRLLRTVGRYAAKIRGMAREFQEGIDDAVREAELDEVKKQIESVRKIDVRETIENTIDPDRRIGKAMDFSDAADPGPGAPEAKPPADAAAEAPRPPETVAAEEPSPAVPPQAEPRAEPAAAARPPSPGRAAGMAASVAAAAAPAPAPAAEPGNQAEARPPAAEAQTTDA